MTYNSGMKQAALASEARNPFVSKWKIENLAWLCMSVSIVVAIVALGIAVHGVLTSGNYQLFLTHQTLNPFITIGFAVIGALVASRHPRNPVGWIFVTVGLLFALLTLIAAIHTYGSTSISGYKWIVWLGSWLWIPATFIPLAFVPLVFPTGHLLSPRWRFAVLASALGLAAIVLGVMLHPGPLSSWSLPANPFGIPGAGPTLEMLINIGSGLCAIGFLGSLAASIVRFRRSKDIERNQMKWLIYAVSINVIVSIMVQVFWSLWPNIPGYYEISILLSNMTILSIAIASAIAILRHRLYDIDLIINRTLVYSALTIGVAILYGLVVGGLGALFQASGNIIFSLLATGLAAVLVQPLRDVLQRLVNRLMYGERDDPYAVLSGLSRQLGSSLPPEAMLPSVVETVAHTLKLPYVAITLKKDEDFSIAASYGLPREDWIQLPLLYQGETIGYLRLSTRSPGEHFTPGEQRLLKDIARHVGISAHTVLITQDLRHLAMDLQHSREQIIKSREEERLKLRRDLHDEIGPQLASLKLNLDVARNLLRRDPKAAEDLLLELRSQTQNAISDIRRLAYDLRPPALDQLGLGSAIREYASQLERNDGLKIQFNGLQNMPSLPAAVEVAVYRIVIESLVNVVRHSQGRNCCISISTVDGNLQVEITDDGVGLPEDVREGVGMNSMRERAAELGGKCVVEAVPQGGTRVLARLPLA